MAEINNLNDLGIWFKNRPGEYAAALSVRALLRVTPLTLHPFVARDGRSLNRRRTSLLPAFRLISLAWVCSAAPRNNIDLKRIIVGAIKQFPVTDSATAGWENAVIGTAEAADIGNLTDDDLMAREAALNAIRSSSACGEKGNLLAGFWMPIDRDVELLDQGVEPEALVASELWYGGIPYSLQDAWAWISDHLLKANEGWEVWTDWYEDRLHGRPFNKALEEARVLIPDKYWRQWPKEVNPEIARLIDEHNDPFDPSSDLSEFDFFISYSVRDEAYARWAARVLYNNGYSVFAQFNDMLPGSNFVVEMHRGLTKSGRMLAILSQDYLDSNACRSEWASAFNLDRDGSNRKLIPIMVRPCAPAGLLAQIVYKRLIGLSAEEAAKALLDATSHNQPLDTIPEAWPGDTSEAEGEITGAVRDATPQGRRVEIDPSSGKVAAKVPDQRPTAPTEISNDVVLANLRRKISRRTKQFSDGSHSDQYVRLRPILDMLDDAIANGSNNPLWLHDDIEQAHREIVDLIRIGDLPETRQAPELAALRLDLRNGLADLRQVYPALADMAGHRRTAHARPLTEAEQKALELALDAFEEIVDEKLQSELREDAAAVLDAEPVALEPDLTLPDGRLKDRLYRLAGMFVRVYRLAKTPADRLRQIFDEGVDVAKRIKDYERAKETLAPIWRELRDWLLDFFS